MPVADKLPCRKHCRSKFRPIQSSVQTAFQKLNQMRPCIPFTAHGFLVITAELPLTNISVIPPQLLLALQLNTVISLLATALPVLTRRIGDACWQGSSACPKGFPPSGVQACFWRECVLSCLTFSGFTGFWQVLLCTLVRAFAASGLSSNYPDF